MSSLKFLVVDDSLTMRRIIMSALHTLGFGQVRQADNGRTAVKVMLDEPCDFIIVDWNMPIMSGIEFVKWVRTNSTFSKTPILMITAKSNTEDIMMALGAEVDDYIIKPFTPQNLKEKIERILKSREEITI